MNHSTTRSDRQRGQASCALLEPGRLPDHGGLATTVIVTMPLETLQAGVGAALLGTGEPITAGLVPAALGSRSEVLGLGCTARVPLASRTNGPL